MGYEELIKAIKEVGERKLRDIWATAESKAEMIRKEAESRATALRMEYEERLNAMVGKKRSLILKETDREAYQIRLKAQEELSERLFSTAVALLPGLRGERYKEIFEALVNEIPHSRWVTVRVNPDDILIAKSCFEGAEIIGDPSITGGFVVENSEGNIIINTFEKRLERLWPEILPGILKTLREMYETPDR